MKFPKYESRERWSDETKLFAKHNKATRCVQADGTLKLSKGVADFFEKYLNIINIQKEDPIAILNIDHSQLTDIILVHKKLFQGKRDFTIDLFVYTNPILPVDPITLKNQIKNFYTEDFIEIFYDNDINNAIEDSKTNKYCINCISCVNCADCINCSKLNKIYFKHNLI